MSETIEAPQIDTAPAPEADPADDLRAAIGAAYDEVAGETTEPPAEPESTEGPARDERGRFASAADPSADPEPAAEPEAASVEAAAPAPVPSDLAPVKAVLDEYRDQYAGRGLAPAEAMRALFGAEKALRERPYDAIAQLARDFGVDLSRFAPQAPQQPPQAAQAQTNDPTVAAALERLQRLEAHISTQQQQQELASRAQTERTIADFAADPKHTHFPAVRVLMGGLMQAGAANDLASAYEMACRAHPEISQTIAKSEAAARERAAAEDRRKAAAEAKAKAVSVRGSSVVNGFTKAPDTLRDTLLAAWDGRLN